MSVAATVRLDHVADVVSGTTPSSGEDAFWGGDIVWATPTDLGRLEGRAVETSERKITRAGYESCNLTMVPAGSVVLSTRAPIGHLGVAATRLCINQGCKVLVPKAGTDTDFLYFALKYSVPALKRLGSGSTFDEVSKAQLSSFEIPFVEPEAQPLLGRPLREQHELVDRAHQACLARSLAARRLSGRLLREAFLDQVPLTVEPLPGTAPTGWRWRELGKIARLESGHTPSRYRPEWWGGDIPWIALPDIRALDGQVTLRTSENTNPDGIANSAARILPTRTVVLSRTASVGFVTIMGRPMATSQDFANWVCGPEIVPEFLLYLLMAARDYIRDLASGAVHKTVYMPTLQAFQVCLPAIPVQMEIATELKSRLAAAEALVTAAAAEHRTIKQLSSAILREAFSGA